MTSRLPSSQLDGRTCKRCEAELVVGLNWCPRWARRRRPGPAKLANPSICTRCGRAADLARMRKPRNRFARLKGGARLRGISLSLDFETYRALIARPCFYCDGPLSPTGGGLDRIDNARGYAVDNVLPACGECHAIRGMRLTIEETQAIVVARKRAA